MTDTSKLFRLVCLKSLRPPLSLVPTASGDQPSYSVPGRLIVAAGAPRQETQHARQTRSLTETGSGLLSVSATADDAELSEYSISVSGERGGVQQYGARRSDGVRACESSDNARKTKVPRHRRLRWRARHCGTAADADRRTFTSRISLPRLKLQQTLSIGRDNHKRTK